MYAEIIMKLGLKPEFTPFKLNAIANIKEAKLKKNSKNIKFLRNL